MAGVRWARYRHHTGDCSGGSGAGLASGAPGIACACTMSSHARGTIAMVCVAGVSTFIIVPSRRSKLQSHRTTACLHKGVHGGCACVIPRHFLHATQLRESRSATCKSTLAQVVRNLQCFMGHGADTHTQALSNKHSHTEKRTVRCDKPAQTRLHNTHDKWGTHGPRA